MAAGAANLSLMLTGQLISVANGLSLSILGVAADPGDVSRQMAERLFLVGAANSLFVVFALVAVILAVLVLVAYVVRIAVLVVLLAGAPLVLVAHALPQTEHLARTWWRLVVAMVVVPVVQALLLAAAVRVFLSGEGVLGLSGGGLIDLLVIGCLLYVLYRIPLWSIDLALHGAGSRAWGTVKRRAATAAKAAVVA
ncbi:MAG: hypothetical protein ACRDIF_01735 [Actinomycetota bacterium]